MWHLENEFSHLSHFKGTFFEAVKIVVGQNEEPLLPPRRNGIKQWQGCGVNLSGLHLILVEKSKLSIE